MIVKQQFVKNQKAIFLGVNSRKDITIHETGNTKKGAGAAAHANLQTNGYSASWHWQVDDKMAIQSYPHTAQCWHAGDGRGRGNLQSIAIEICVNEDGHYMEAINNAIFLTKKIMAEENISIEHVVMHHEWSQKNCPSILRSGSRGITWASFKQQLQKVDSVDDLKVGSMGSAVQKLQEHLNKLAYHLIVDGSFGPATEKAVIFFQSMYGLKIDGVVGKETKTLLTRLIQESIAHTVNVLRYGKKDKAVGQLQRYLNELQFQLTIDNSFGLKTKEAVQQFQRKYRLEVDGLVGPKTWMKLKKCIFQ